MDKESEKDRLNKVAKKYSAFSGFEKLYLEHRLRRVLNFCWGRTALEVGCADGLSTSQIVKHFERVVVVEGSKRYVEVIQKKIVGKAQFHLSLFEDFETEKKFDTIFLLSILEHVKDPQLILKKARSMLSEDGVILITVPNAGSLHRRVGVLMGLLKSCEDFSDSDREIGHRRVYSLKNLRNELIKAKLKIENLEGIGTKPLSNKQMEKLPRNTTRAFLELDKKMPTELCASLFARCQKGKQ